MCCMNCTSCIAHISPWGSPRHGWLSFCRLCPVWNCWCLRCSAELVHSAGYTPSHNNHNNNNNNNNNNRICGSKCVVCFVCMTPYVYVMWSLVNTSVIALHWGIQHVIFNMNTSYYIIIYYKYFLHWIIVMWRPEVAENLIEIQKTQSSSPLKSRVYLSINQFTCIHNLRPSEYSFKVNLYFSLAQSIFSTSQYSGGNIDTHVHTHTHTHVA